MPSIPRQPSRVGFALWIGSMAALRVLLVSTLGVAAALLPSSARAAVPASERQALVDLYNATNGPSWTSKTNWLGAAGTECSWFGVVCGADQSHVFEIRLDDNNLNGPLPPSMSNLTELHAVHVPGNSLSGGIEVICDWPLVFDLVLHANQFSGPIPSCIGSLSGLRNLTLFANQLSGPIPSEFWDLTLLEHVHMEGNALTGSLPSQVGNLSALRDLWLYGNQLGGNLPPEIGSLSSLETLNLSDNLFTGSIPSEIGNLSNLVTLAIAENQFSGSLPSDISRLSSLVGLSADSNQLSGALPAEIGDLTSLRHLSLHSNQLSGPIPPEIGNLASLDHLRLGANRFTGSIPPTIGNLSALTLLSLESNALVGEIPGSMTGLTKLQELHLEWNGLYSNDAELSAFLNARHWGPFENTQTVAPANFSVTATTSSSVTLRWTPIRYTDDGGGYRVHVATSPAGPFTLVTVTSDKLASGAMIDSLEPFASYSFRVDTITPPHGDQKNGITSDVSDVVTATTISSQGGIALVSSPDVMTAFADGASTDSTTLTIANLGSRSTSVLLLPDGNFFTIATASLTLDPGVATSVFITSIPQSTPGDHRGRISLSGSEVPPGLEVNVTLFAAPPQPEGSPRVEVESTRVDVSAARDESPTGAVSFRNTGDATATGILGADQAWIVPESSILAIEPGESRAFSFSIDRGKRPDAGDLAGTQQGTLSLVYVAGLGSILRRSPFDGVPTLAAPVGITDTVKPTAVACPPAPLPCWIEIPPLAGGQIGLVAPGVGNVTGSVGLFVSDISIGNRGGMPVDDLSLYFSGKAVALDIDTGRAVSLADVSSTVFDTTERVSALHLRSSRATEIAMNANVFVKSNPNGTFGTALPVFRTDRGAVAGTSVILTGLRRTATSHTNLYVQELSGTSTSFDVVFLDGSGNILGQMTGQELPAFGTSILGQALVPEGSVTAIVTTTGAGSIAAFATPVDRASNDTWAVADWGQVYGFDGTQTQYVAVAGSAPGRNDTYFQTDLAMYASSSGTATLRYYQQTPSIDVLEQTVSFDASETRIYEDVVTGLFGATAPSLGSIEIVPGTGLDLTVTSRTYTTVAGLPDTFGTGVPALTSAEALRNGRSVVIGGLEDSTAGTTDSGTPGSFRTNVGLVEIEGAPVRARVSVLLYDGTHLSTGGATVSRTYDLAAHQWQQLNAIVGEIVGRDVRERDFGELHNVQVRVDVLGGEGAIIVYATTTDNGTGDTVLRVE